MGSRSTDVKCCLGGLQGRALKAGDVLETGKPETGEHAEKENARIPKEKPVKYERSVEVRVVEGPQADWFSGEARDQFFRESYTVSAESDRMGIRLNGAPVESLHGTDIVSDGIAFGSIQITKSGMPIVMMADHQTTGGYAKIGTVCSFDLPKLAQHLYLHPEERRRSKPLALTVRTGGSSGTGGRRRYRFQKYNYYYRHGGVR